MMHHLMTDAGILYINPDGKPAALVFAPEHVKTKFHELLTHMIKPVTYLDRHRPCATAIASAQPTHP